MNNLYDITHTKKFKSIVEDWSFKTIFFRITLFTSKEYGDFRVFRDRSKKFIFVFLGV